MVIALQYNETIAIFMDAVMSVTSVTSVMSFQGSTDVMQKDCLAPCLDLMI